MDPITTRRAFAVIFTIFAMLLFFTTISSHRKRLLARLLQPPVDRPTDVHSPTRLRLLSYNVWGHYVVGGGRLTSRLDALARQIELSRVDIVCLQELFILRAGPIVHMEYFLRFAEQMRRIGLVYTVDPLTGMRPALQNSGLALFSRYPIIHWSHTAFSRSSEPVNSKGIMTAIISIGGATFHIVNAHLDSRDAVSQKAQASEVANAAAGLMKTPSLESGRHLIAVGDFNIHSSKFGLYKHLCDCMAAAGAPVDIFPGPSSNAATYMHGPSWIDHAFASPDVTSCLLRSAVVDLCVDGSGMSFEGGHDRAATPFGTAFCEPPTDSPMQGAASISDHRGLLMEFSLRRNTSDQAPADIRLSPRSKSPTRRV
jgi:endonuclease/exonuclease/phosphatase family metal-dependent hydrolase